MYLNVFKPVVVFKVKKYAFYFLKTNKLIYKKMYIKKKLKTGYEKKKNNSKFIII